LINVGRGLDLDPTLAIGRQFVHDVVGRFAHVFSIFEHHVSYIVRGLSDRLSKGRADLYICEPSNDYFVPIPQVKAHSPVETVSKNSL